MYYETPNKHLIKAGEIKKARVLCPCCDSEYEIELRSDHKDGSATVCMERHEDYGYIPVVYMNCEVCGVHFKDLVVDDDMYPEF